MDVKTAVAAAKDYIGSVYADESVQNIGLEEVEFDASSDVWRVTVGFSRPWDSPVSRAAEVLQNMGAWPTLKRSYKAVVVSGDGRVLSMKNLSSLQAAE